MKTLSTHHNKADARARLVSLLGYLPGRHLDAETWQSGNGIAYGLRYAAEQGWKVVELSAVEAIDVRLAQTARLAEEHMARANGHEARALELENAGNHGLAASRRLQADSERDMAATWIDELRMLVQRRRVIDTTVASEGEKAA